MSNGNVAYTVEFTYDAAGRRTQIKYSNTAVAQLPTADYGYDNADQITSITYRVSGGFIGNLYYTYDAAGRRQVPSGTFAQIRLPANDATATYNANNQLTVWNGVGLIYDNNGNLTSFGSTHYTWNARGQLTGISGPLQATFAYDGLGRRIRKSINGVATGYVYDGLTVVQEKNNATQYSVPVSNIVSGLGLDEPLLSMTGSGAGLNVVGFMRDANNNTVHVFSRVGSINSSYSYEPYGTTTKFGDDPTAQQYTGRENDDQTGLYYYRARYYHPGFGRFISEDPIEFAGGSNLYAYVGGRPIDLRDPTGELAFLVPVVGFLGGAAFDVLVQIGTGMYDGQTAWDAAANINLTQTLVAGVAGAAGAGAFAIAADIFKAKNLFEIPFEALTRAERNQIGDLAVRAQAAIGSSLAKVPIGRMRPWRPFASDCD